MTHSPFVIIKGEAACLSRGFEKLKQNTISLKIKTADYEKKRKFQLVDVDEYDPVFNMYENKGKFYADVVTGTLYHPKTGECLSSDQIKLILE